MAPSMKLEALLAVGAVLVTISACKSKDYENCLSQVDTYEKGKLDCLSKSDAKDREACTNQNEVRKITRQDCNDSYH